MMPQPAEAKQSLPETQEALETSPTAPGRTPACSVHPAEVLTSPDAFEMPAQEFGVLHDSASRVGAEVGVDQVPLVQICS